MMNGWDGGMSATGWLFMSLFWVLLVVLIVWAAATLFPGRRQLVTGSGHSTGHAPEAPRAILDRRLASGELDVDAYDKLCAKLDSKEVS